MRKSWRFSHAVRMNNVMAKSDRKIEEWRKANPWVIVNVQSSQTRCGRFPTYQAAVDYANANYGGVVGVEGTAVLVSQMPSL